MSKQARRRTGSADSSVVMAVDTMKRRRTHEGHSDDFAPENFATEEISEDFSVFIMSKFHSVKEGEGGFCVACTEWLLNELV